MSEDMPQAGPALEGMGREELIAALLKAEQGLERLRQSERKQRQDQKKILEITHALRERVKELNCLYQISEIVATHGFDLDLILKRTVEIIPDAWQYPDATCCRIRLKDHMVMSPDFRETEWVQSQAITVNGERQGLLEVYYRQRKPARDEGPFLAEERSLINVIAERIGKIAERERAEHALYESELKNTALLSAVPDLMFQIDRQGTMVGFHEGTFVTLRELARQIVGRNVYYLAEQDLVPRRLLDQGMIYIRQTLDTGNPQVFEQHTHFHGKIRDYEVRMVVCRGDEVLGMVRDVTHRKRLEREILEISNREQRRIGQDLHDSLSQHLAGIGFMTKVLERKATNHQPLQPQEVGEIVDLVDQAITLTRGFARGLNPVELMSGGLMVALDELAHTVAKLFGVSCVFACDTPIPIHSNEMAIHLYRITQEALNNAIKHGKAKSITIALEQRGANCVLIVSDNGVGLKKTTGHGGGMGLNIMRYRASMFGGILDIRESQSGGTEITCSFLPGTKI